MTDLIKPLTTGLAFVACTVAVGTWIAYPVWKAKQIRKHVDAIERGR